MRTLSEDRLDRLSNNGFTVFRFKSYAMVRLYSRLCSSSFWKRHCPIYHIVKIKEESHG